MPDPTEPSLRGRLLVAAPVLQDRNFDRTVVLVVEDNADGAIGIVLNRPSDAELGEAFGHLRPIAADPPLIFVGGPVGLDALVCLVRPGTAAEPPERFAPLVGASGVLDLGAHLDRPPPGAEALRLFVGYSGWDAGQLAAEREAGAWFTVDALEDDLLTGDPRSLWRRVLKRQGGHLALVSTYPRHPWLN